MVKKLRYRNSEISDMYDRYGLKTGLVLRVIRVFPFDGSIEVKYPDGSEVVLSGKLASNVFCVRE
jgi:DtxR family Mn-dependent transcriptional regulator